MIKNILIVCEGESTEPNYFNHLKDILIDRECPISITISPRPPNIDEGNEYEKRPGSKTRTLKITEKEKKEELSVVEDQFKAQPIAYVREAQKGLEDGTYEEVWAVYDKDGHPKHKEAYDLALEDFDGKSVNLGFSSISFEFWILLHFEDSKIAFERSMCRSTNPTKYYYCGSDEKHENDCSGENCVCGRIVTQKYLSYNGKKKDFDFESYFPNVYDAIKRAVKLEKSYDVNTNLIYNLNPITTIYRLVFELLHFQNIIFTWFQFNQTQNYNKLKITFHRNESEIRIIIELSEIKTEIINKDFICLFDVKGNKISFHKRVILNEVTNEIEFKVNLEQFENSEPLFIGYKLSELEEYCISPF
ncbi:RloB family protein [Leeuwenhoekiella sp. H156]|uniref:RloB family protein n=1 Tax=Leeuwenhoekiella sp. H156 TaxID=3450128 RepID=UPI003FA45F02